MRPGCFFIFCRDGREGEIGQVAKFVFFAASAFSNSINQILKNIVSIISRLFEFFLNCDYICKIYKKKFDKFNNFKTTYKLVE